MGMKQDIFRLFESETNEAKRDPGDWRNYVVYFLQKTAFEHIYIRHGYKRGFDIDSDKPTHTLF